MNMGRFTKSISFLLLLCFMILELSSVAEVFAAERRARENEKQLMRDAGAGIVGWADQYEELDEHTVPEAIGYEKAKWKNHIERMYEEEGKNLNRVIFKNADGSRTQYIFDYPVKYKNENGEIEDSSFEIKDSKERGFKFETAASVSKTRFPEDIRDGIELSGNDTQITLIPHDAKRSEPERIDEETISYICDENTTIEYSLTYTGFKEDIVVSEYTGQTEYEFTIYTEGLKLVEIDGSYYLIDENGEIKATIGDIIIFTADEKNNAFGELEAETIIENWEYRMKIVLDPEYLADEKTVYPIRIDPTVEITYDNDGAGAIEDVTINSLKGSSGSSGSLSVGLREKYGISRILMKFPGLNLNSLGTNIEITNATVELRDLMCEGSYLTVSCYVFAGNEWTESTANWSNVSPNSTSTFLSSNSISYYNGVNLSTKHRYSFDITEAVKGWKEGNYNQNKGVIFKATSTIENGSTYDSRTIASYNRASNKPSLSVTYEVKTLTDISINVSEESIIEGSSETLIATTNINGVNISWSSSNASVATVNSSGKVTGLKAGVTTITAKAVANGNTCTDTCTVYVTVPNGVYYIKNLNSNYYLTAKYGDINNKTDVIQRMKFSTSSSLQNQLSQMWKIYYLGGGRYSIRPMHKLNMGLDVTSSNVDIWNIGRTDSLSSIPSYGEWTIERSSEGYVFKNNGLSNLTMQVSGGSVSSGATIVAGSYSTSVNAQWGLEEIDTPPSGVIIYNTSTQGVIPSSFTRAVPVGETRTLSSMQISGEAYSDSSIKQTIYWKSSDTSIASVNISTGEVTGKSEGEVTITAYAYVNGVRKSDTYKLVVLPIENGTYFIKNRQYGRYLQIDDNDTVSDYTTSGAIMEQWDYDGEDYQKWLLTSLDNGYYKIISVESDLALSVKSAEISSQDVALVQEAYTGAYRQQWKITRTENGSYKIKPRSSENQSNDFVMAVGDSIINDSNGVDIEQRVYTDDFTYKDEWYIGEKRIFNATINHFYDMGYCVRFDETPEESEANILRYMAEIAEIYEEEFGLQLNYSVTYYNSPIDQCKGEVTEENIDTLCSHSADHTNKDNMMRNFDYDFDYLGNATSTNVYWTGHRLSLENGAGDGNGSCSWDYSVYLLGINVSDEDREHRSHRGLLHELNHQFGAPDHYHTDENDVKDEDGNVIETGKCGNSEDGCATCGDIPRDASCIMGETRQENKNWWFACEECTEDIMTHLIDHHE